MMHDSLVVLDFGSQYSQLIVRRLRELQVSCSLFPWDAPERDVLAENPKGFILSGGPASVHDRDAPSLPEYVLQSGLPLLGVCYGMQLLAHSLGGQVEPSPHREYGTATIDIHGDDSLLTGITTVWMSHGDRITKPPPGFAVLAESAGSPIAAMGDPLRRYYAVQFHPEVGHTPNGSLLLKHFAVEICACKPEWTAQAMITDSVDAIRKQVGKETLLAAVSGGVDSTVATALAHRALGKQLVAVFVDTGLLRKNEAQQVIRALREGIGMELFPLDASAEFLDALQGIIDPEDKRRIIGEKFIRVFEREAHRLGTPRFLLQGTIYPDVIESSAPERSKGARIKSHHNVGGLPDDMHMELVEPLRYLFKDEVRAVGEALGLPAEMVWRQPFPGPGLAVRCLGEVNRERVTRLREADAILIEEISSAGLLGKTGSISQAFVVLLPVRSVGVMGDERTYQETAVIRAVSTEDFMTADWVRLPHDLLARVSNRIVNEVPGINRVVYDITSKPPATIEWE